MELGTAPEGWERPISAVPVGAAGSQLQQAVYGSDKELAVKFFLHRVVNETESALKNVKVFDTKEFVRIQRIGEKLTVFMGEATLTHKRRFPYQYQAFREGKGVVKGILIHEWDYQLSESDIMTFRTLGINYVHELANMSPDQQDVLGLDAKRIVARAKIDSAEIEVKEQATSMQRELDELRSLLAKQADENEQIRKLLEIRKDEREEEERKGREGLLSAAHSVNDSAKAIEELEKQLAKRKATKE